MTETMFPTGTKFNLAIINGKVELIKSKNGVGEVIKIDGQQYYSFGQS
jgi:hypothetical protein